MSFYKIETPFESVLTRCIINHKPLYGLIYRRAHANMRGMDKINSNMIR